MIYAYRDVIDTPKFTAPRHSLYVRDLRILREGTGDGILLADTALTASPVADTGAGPSVITQ